MVHAEVSPTWDRIELTPEWNETELLKLIPGASYRKKRWSLPLAWASVVMLRGYFQARFTMSTDLQAWAWDVRRQRIDPAMELRARIDHVRLDAQEDMPWAARMYPFQRAGVEFMRVAMNGLLGDELGVGKTVTALSFIRSVEADISHGVIEWAALPALVICPNRVKHHWARRVPEWCPQATPYVIEKGTVRGRKIIESMRDDPSAILIVNYESVKLFSRLEAYGDIKLKRCKECDPRHGDDIRSSQCHVHPKELNGLQFHTVIVDEAHNIGDPKSQQTRAAWRLMHAPGVYYRWALTGTPDNVKRLWSIMHGVAPEDYGARSKWMERYALYAWNSGGGADVVGMRPDTRDEAYRVLDPRFRRMLKAIVLPQLPPKVRQTQTAEMSPQQKRAYDELDARLWTRLPDGQLLIAQNQLVGKTRLMQFAAGTVKVDKPDPDDVASWKVTIGNPSPKLDLLEEVLDELGNDHPFLVSVVHRDVARLAAERLAKRGIRHALIMGGEVTPEQAVQYTEDQKAGNLHALVFTVSMGGEGLDMSGADTLIRVQRSWSLIQNLQVEDRCHRIGSERYDSINVIDLVTADTIEEKQVAKLLDKLEQLDEITRDRAVLAAKLAETPHWSEDYGQLVAKMIALTQRQQDLLQHDELDIWPKEAA